MSLTNEQGPKCPICKKTAIKLVPMQPSDQKHTGQLACRDCKRKIINGEKIEKYARME